VFGVKASRFVFLTVSARRDRPERSTMDGVIWMLVSPNNRPLGRCEKPYQTYGACREAVLRLREQCDRLKSLAFAVEETGQWTWRIELDGQPVAISGRSYLRVRECHYNLDRFLAAVAIADIVPGTREVRWGRRFGGTPDPPAEPRGAPLLRHGAPPPSPAAAGAGLPDDWPAIRSPTG
jgi:hypothetical protein